MEGGLPDDALVTVSRVETARNLRSATIWLSIFPPEGARAIVEELCLNLYTLQGSLNRKLNLHPLPRIRLNLDYGAQQAENVERRLKELG